MATRPARFSIIDFYLSLCARYDIRGYVAPHLQLLDVGKLDTLSHLPPTLPGCPLSDAQILANLF